MPIGTIISFMGTIPPENYLVCDGSELNIVDYPDLAGFFELQFGSKNNFGGDGTTTFAVPDLRGEFLRGTGTNSHADQGSGANVGVHQDGTLHTGAYTGNSNTEFGLANTPWSYGDQKNGVKADNSQGKTTMFYIRGSTYTKGVDMSIYTSRPTNTSVLYCIKAN